MQIVGGILLLLLIFLGIGKMVKLFIILLGLVLLCLLWYYKNGSKEAAELLEEGEPEYELSRGELAALAENRNQLNKHEVELDELNGIKKLIISKIENLYDIGDNHGLRRRNDNYFDNRSAKGKELNENIEELEEDLHTAKGHISDSEDTIAELTEARSKIEGLPNDRKFYATAQKVSLCIIAMYAVFTLYYFTTH